MRKKGKKKKGRRRRKKKCSPLIYFWIRHWLLSLSPARNEQEQSEHVCSPVAVNTEKRGTMMCCANKSRASTCVPHVAVNT